MKKALFFSILFLTAFLAKAQRAELHIVNSSQRTLTIKVMEDLPSADIKYSTLEIAPYGRATEYFSKTGNYYLKSEATLPGQEPVYQKGHPFKVYVGSDGYSVLTITISIVESQVANPLEGRRISRAEFERNN